MRTVIKLLVLSMFLTTGFAFVGCEPAAEEKAKTPAVNDKKEESSKDDKTSMKTDEDSADLVTVSLKIPKLKPG